MDSDLEIAEGILRDILTVRMYGEDDHTPTWRDLESRIESYLRRDDSEVPQLDDPIEELTEAIRLTVEYVGTDTLPPIVGWGWYDALWKYAPEKIPGYPRTRNV